MKTKKIFFCICTAVAAVFAICFLVALFLFPDVSHEIILWVFFGGMLIFGSTAYFIYDDEECYESDTVKFWIYKVLFHDGQEGYAMMDEEGEVTNYLSLSAKDELIYDLLKLCNDLDKDGSLCLKFDESREVNWNIKDGTTFCEPLTTEEFKDFMWCFQAAMKKFQLEKEKKLQEEKFTKDFKKK